MEIASPVVQLSEAAGRPVLVVAGCGGPRGGRGGIARAFAPGLQKRAARRGDRRPLRVNRGNGQDGDRS